MANSAISVPAQVTNSAGRTGVVLYDNAAITDNYQPSAIIIYGDNTYEQVSRGPLTVVVAAGSPGVFPPGFGPGN